MGKLFKFLAALIGALVVLVLAAVIILPLVIDPNDYKDEIIAQVKKATGRDLSIQGDIGLSVFPWLGLELEGLQLSNAKGFGDAPFASVGQAGVRVKLIPILSKQLEVDTVILDGLQLNLAKAKDGRSNWDDLGAAGEKAPPAPAEKAPKATGEGKAKLAALAIGGVAIRNARLSWDDQSSGRHFIVDQLNLEAGALTPGKAVDLELNFQVESKEPALKARIRLTGNPLLDLEGQRLSIHKLALNLDAEGEAFQGKAFHARLETGLAMDMVKQTLSLDGLQLSAADLSLSGQIKGSNLNQSPAFSGELKLAEFDLRKWMTSQGLPVPETADPKALTRVGLTTSLGATEQSIQLQKLALILDDSRLDGGLKVQNFEQPAIGFDLTIDAIDLDRYLPPPAEEGAEGEKVAASAPSSPVAAQAEQELLPVETLRQLNLDGVVRIGRLMIKKLLAEEVEVSIKARDGRIKVDQQIKRFYEGSLKGGAEINVQGKEPQMTIDESLTKVQAGPLLKDLTGEGRLTGAGRFDTRLTTGGNTDSAMRRNLNGNLAFRFENGAVKGINLAQTIREAKARFSGQPVAPSQSPPQTDFSELGGSAVITDGVLTNKDLMAKSPFLRVVGAGTANLVSEVLDYTLKTTIVGSIEGQGGKELAELQGVPIPVRVKGGFAQPEYSVNWAEIVAETQKAKIDEKKEEVKQKLEEKLQEKLKGFGGFLR